MARRQGARHTSSRFWLTFHRARSRSITRATPDTLAFWRCYDCNRRDGGEVSKPIVDSLAQALITAILTPPYWTLQSPPSPCLPPLVLLQNGSGRDLEISQNDCNTHTRACVCMRVHACVRACGWRARGRARLVVAAAMRLAHRLAYPLRTQIDGVPRAHRFSDERSDRERLVAVGSVGFCICPSGNLKSVASSSY